MPLPHSVTMQGCLTELLHLHGSAGEISTWDATVGDKILRLFQYPNVPFLQDDLETTAVLTARPPCCSATAVVYREGGGIWARLETLLAEEGSPRPASSPHTDVLL